MTDDLYQNQVMLLARDERLAGTLSDATATATVGEVMRKTSEIQRHIISRDLLRPLGA